MRADATFYKVTGSGNDFVMFDGREVPAASLAAEEIVWLCDRRLGAGADGVAVLEPTEGPAHFRFHFWNSDGSPAPMCGNGALCATRLAGILGMTSGDAVRFLTPAGLMNSRIVGDEAELLLPDCTAPQSVPAVRLGAGEAHPALVVPSVPHLVVQVPDVDAVALSSRGPALRHDPALGPGGANVNWISPAGEGSWKMRTYERGVEGETLACATGAAACALALAQRGLAASPTRFHTRSRHRLLVTWEWAEDGQHATTLTIRGEARLVFEAKLRGLPVSSDPAR